jgi:trehalose 6-phosphate phosphatase
MEQESNMYYEMIGFVQDSHGREPCEDGVPDVELGGISLFLDFDGTLVELADAPDAIDVDSGLGHLLRMLAEKCGGRVVIVTGRAIGDVVTYLGDFDGPIIGGHGAEKRMGGAIERLPMADEGIVARLGDMTEAFAATHPGMLCERKPTGVVLHFRQAPEQDSAAYAFLRALADSHDGFDLHHSKMAYELRPEGIGKDISIREVMALDGYKGTRPVFFGDDVTDEPALQWTAEVGGLAVKVGQGDTVATNRLPDPAAARSLLRKWAGPGKKDNLHQQPAAPDTGAGD